MRINLFSRTWIGQSHTNLVFPAQFSVATSSCVTGSPKKTVSHLNQLSNRKPMSPENLMKFSRFTVKFFSRSLTLLHSRVFVLLFCLQCVIVCVCFVGRFELTNQFQWLTAYRSCVCYHSLCWCLISNSCVNEYRTATVVAVDLSLAMYTHTAECMQMLTGVFLASVSVLFAANKTALIHFDGAAIYLALNNAINALNELGEIINGSKLTRYWISTAKIVNNRINYFVFSLNHVCWHWN